MLDRTAPAVTRISPADIARAATRDDLDERQQAAADRLHHFGAMLATAEYAVHEGRDVLADLRAIVDAEIVTARILGVPL